MGITLTIEAANVDDFDEQIRRFAAPEGEEDPRRYMRGEPAATTDGADYGRTATEAADTEDKPKRKRRTKAEIEAEKAEEERRAKAEGVAHIPQAPEEPEPAKPTSKNIDAFKVPTSVDDLRTILQTIAAAEDKGPTVAASVLQGLGYGKVSDVPPEKYAEFAQRADKAMA